MFFRYALQQMPTLFVFAKKTAEEKEPHIEKRGDRLISQTKIYLGKENKNCIISFRVTPEEKKWIKDRSYGHYQLISDFVRDCVFKKEMIIITGADDVAAELRRIGNNVNQLTRAVNAGYASQINLTETRKELEKIWQSLNSLLQDAR